MRKRIVSFFKLLFVLMLVIIPIPVAQLFARVFRTGRKNEVTQVLKRDG